MAVDTVREVAGRRLDWIAEFDERSRQYPVREAAKAPVVASVRWIAGAVLDQGQYGTCVGNGHAGEVGAAPVQRPIDEPFAVKIYDSAKTDFDKQPDPQRQAGTSVLSGAKAVSKLGFYVGGYKWAFNLNDLIHGIATVGPSVIGINWYESMFHPDRSGLIRISGQVAGGHCVLIRGVDTKNKRFRIRNSWGTSWGVKGDAIISYSDVDRLIHEQGEFCFPVERPV